MHLAGGICPLPHLDILHSAATACARKCMCLTCARVLCERVYMCVFVFVCIVHVCVCVRARYFGYVCNV